MTPARTTQGRDLGTYHVRVELVDGRGWLDVWHTGWRLTHGTDSVKPLSGRWITPTYEDEAALLNSMRFMYTEGNYSCDCNKRLSLARAQQQDDPEDTDNPCGDTLQIARLTAIRPDRAEIILWRRG